MTKPQGWHGPAHYQIKVKGRLGSRGERVRDNIDDQLLTFFRGARFLDVKQIGQQDTIIGSLSF